MFRYRTRALLLTASFAAGAIPLSAHADFTLHAWENRSEREGQLRLGASFQYFSTDTNYDYQGTLLAPSGLEKYTRLVGDLDATLGLSSRLSAFGRLNWSRAEIDNTSRPGNSFGLGDQTVGLNYRFYDRATDGGMVRSVGIQAQVDLPAYDNAKSDTDLTPHLGDQSIDATIGGFVTGRVLSNRNGSIDLTGGAGYTYRNKGFAAALPWSFELAYRPAHRSGFSGSLMFYGVQTLKGDARANQFSLVSSTSVSAGSGGSYITGAINPTLLAVKGAVGYESSDDVAVKLTVMRTLYGQFQPSGTTFGAMLEKRFGGEDSRRELRDERGPGRAKSNSGFVSYSFEARVTRVNDRLHQVKIDRGSQDTVEPGQVFDLFTTRTDGSLGEPVARARVTSVDTDHAVLTVSEYFKEVWIEEGFVAKRPLQ